MADPLTLVLSGVAIAGAGVALSRRTDPDKPVADTKGTNQATRGARSPYLLGRQLINPPFAANGNRRIRTKQSAGQKGLLGGQGVELNIYEEDAALILGPGPGYAIHSVEANGKVIWNDGIVCTDPDVPDEIAIDAHTSMKVFWGGLNQEEDARLQSLMGVRSRFPGVWIVAFFPMRLGESNSWPVIRIEAESQPIKSPIPATGELPWGYEDIIEASPVSDAIMEVQNGGPSANRMWVRGYVLDRYSIGKDVQLASPHLPGGVSAYELKTIEYDRVRSRQYVWGALGTVPDPSTWAVLDGTFTEPSPGVGRADVNPATNKVIIEKVAGDWIAGPPESECWQEINVSVANALSPHRIKISLFEDSVEIGYVQGDHATGIGADKVSNFIVSGGIRQASVFSAAAATFRITTGEPYVRRYAQRKIRIEISSLNSPLTTQYVLLGGALGNVSNGFCFIWEAGGTKLTFDATLSGFANYVGALSPYDLLRPSGINIAHAIAHLMFGKRPYGMGMDVGYFYLPSLEAIGEEFGDEFRINLHWPNNDRLEDLLEAILLEHGIALILDFALGQFAFRLLREDNPVIEIPVEDIAYPGTIRQSKEGEREITEASYTFNYRAYRYRDVPLSLTYSGSNDFGNRQGASRRRIESVQDLEEAAKVVSRLSAIDLLDTAGFSIQLFREARYLEPGTAVRLPGHSERYRVASLQPSTEGRPSEAEIVLDTYGTNRPAIVPGGTTNSQAQVPPLPDPLWMLWEFPRLLISQRAVVTVLRCRAHSYVRGSEIFASNNNANYQLVANMGGALVGGRLVSGFSAGAEDGADIVETGPEFSVAGSPPYDRMLDLSGDEASWRAMAQLALLYDPATGAEEIVAVRSVTIISTEVFRIDGLIRAQLGTFKKAFGPSSVLFLWGFNIVPNIESPLHFAAGSRVWVKSAPYTTSQIDPATLTPQVYDLAGRWVVPMPATQVRRPDCIPTYPAGADFELTWSWMSSLGYVYRTGAGLQGAGDACGISPPDGSFLVELTDPLQPSLKLTLPAVLPPLTVPISSVVSTFGAAPDTLDVSVCVTESGRTSVEKATISLRKV